MVSVEVLERMEADLKEKDEEMGVLQQKVGEKSGLCCFFSNKTKF